MENCTIKIIKKLSCCITGKSILAAASASEQCSQSPPAQLQPHQQQIQSAGLSAQQQPEGPVKQLHSSSSSLLTRRDNQPRPGAQSGTTTLKIKRLLVLPPSPSSQSVNETKCGTENKKQDTTEDYASATKSALVIEGPVLTGPGNSDQNDNTVPKDRALSVESSKCSGHSDEIFMSAVDHQPKKCSAIECVIDGELRSSVNDNMKPTTDTDINHSNMDIDRSFAKIGNGPATDEADEDEEDPYAELDMYLEKVKVSRMIEWMALFYDRTLS